MEWHFVSDRNIHTSQPRFALRVKRPNRSAANPSVVAL
jgi:hypothetical protein